MLSPASGPISQVIGCHDTFRSVLDIIDGAVVKRGRKRMRSQRWLFPCCLPEHLSTGGHHLQSPCILDNEQVVGRDAQGRVRKLGGMLSGDTPGGIASGQSEYLLRA